MENPDLIINEQKPHVAGYLYYGERPHVLMEAVYNKLKPTSMLDVGCGPCPAISKFSELGVTDIVGLDGDDQLISGQTRSAEYVEPFLDKMIIFDLEGSSFVMGKKFDLVWSFEVAEHIEKVENYVETLTANCAKFIVMTHALPNQIGYHHVNCQDDAYWIEKIEAKGFKLRSDLVELFKEANGQDTCSRYFCESGLVFERI
jgi:2-polyprenyl-3-methyl-5-hydroxy-6-metoxy-1,4-benzoquinol methylase